MILISSITLRLDLDFPSRKGVKIGAAYRSVSDTGKSLEQRKGKRMPEDAT